MIVILTDEEIKKIALLARLSDNLTDQEILDYKTKLSPIIKIAAELKEVDTSGIATTDGTRSVRINSLREDISTLNSSDQKAISNYQRIRKNILQGFQSKFDKQKNYSDLLTLPRIFAES